MESVNQEMFHVKQWRVLIKKCSTWNNGECQSRNVPRETIESVNQENVPRETIENVNQENVSRETMGSVNQENVPRETFIRANLCLIIVIM